MMLIIVLMLSVWIIASESDTLSSHLSQIVSNCWSDAVHLKHVTCWEWELPRTIDHVDTAPRHFTPTDLKEYQHKS